MGGMNPDMWRAVDQKVISKLRTTDPALDAALARSAASELPQIQVAANQGKLLMILAMSLRATRILEVGTLGGFSTIYLSCGVGMGGEVISLELSPTHAAVARQNLADAGLASVAEVIEGPAIESMKAMVDRNEPQFDMVFIDADKGQMPEYFELAVRLTRSGGLIIADNVIRGGAVLDEHSADPAVAGTLRLFRQAGEDPRVHATAVQMVGEKGYDGMLIAVVR
jgi:predicted O-methyltransferase YrrM